MDYILDDLEEYFQSLEDLEDYLDELEELEAMEETAAEEEALLLQIQDEEDRQNLIDALLDEEELQEQLDVIEKAYEEALREIGEQYSMEDLPVIEAFAEEDEDFLSPFELIMPTLQDDPDDPELLNIFMNPEDKFKMS